MINTPIQWDSRSVLKYKKISRDWSMSMSVVEKSLHAEEKYSLVFKK